MKDDILFYEKQSFWRNRLLIIILIPVNAIVIWGFVQQIISGNAWGDNPMNNLGLIVKMGGLLLISVILFLSKLKTIITEEGVYIRLLPFALKTRFFAWEDIEEAYVRRYRPLREYGGWGVRLGWKGGIAYNVYGNIGLQLVFNNGKKLLIGTNRAEELAEVLKKINGKREQK